MTRLYLYGAILAVLIAVGSYFVWDIRKDAQAALKAEQSSARIDDLKAARKRNNETQSLSDDDLRDRLIDRLQSIGPQ